MKKSSLFALLFALYGTSAFPQIAKPLNECEAILGQPIKVHATDPPARLYLHKGLHVQVTYETGKAVAAIYRIPSPSGNLRISSDTASTVFQLNGFSADDLVALDPKLPQAVSGLYKATKDGKIVILNDPAENVIVLFDFDYLQRSENKLD